MFLKQVCLAVLALFLMGSASAQVDSDDPEFEFETNIERADTHSVSDERLDHAFAVLQGDEDLQKVRPEWEPEAPELNNRRSGSNPILRAIAAFFGAIGEILGYLLALLVIVAILAGLCMVFGESISFRGKQKEKHADPDVSTVPNLRPEQKRARALLEDADALAAQGKFAEAVHLLLFRSIDEIQEQRSGLIGRALTAREIGALGILPNAVREALMPIIRVVERSFFGGQEVGEPGWQEARASYESFAFGEAWA